MSSSGFSEEEIDRCHEATEFDHRCAVCDPEERRNQASQLKRRRDLLVDTIENFGTKMPAEERLRYYDELETIFRKLQTLET